MRILFVCLCFIIMKQTFAADPFDVGVMDSGIVENDASGFSSTISEMCFSGADIPFTSNVLETLAQVSLCQNGGTFHSTSASIPRRYQSDYSNSNLGIIDEVAGDRHGSDVLIKIREVNTNIKSVVANTSVCSHDTSTGVFPNSCGFTTGANLQLGRSFDVFYLPLNEVQLNTVAVRSSKLGAINISYGSREHTSCPSDLSDVFFNFKNIKKIAIVAATGNDGDKTNPAFPACNSDVISVASAQELEPGFPPLISSTAVWNMETDFFAVGARGNTYDGELDPEFDGLDINAVGSSYAAPRVSAAFSILRGEAPLMSVDEIKQALISASFNLGLDVNACRGGVCKSIPFVDISTIQKAIEIVNTNSTVPVELDPIELDVPLPDLFGWDHEDTNNKFGVALNVLLEQEPSSDYSLTFEAFDISFFGELQIYINGFYFADIAQTSSGEFTLSEYTIPSELLMAGNNTIEFRVNGEASTWAIRNIILSNNAITIVPVIMLQLDD